MITIYAPYKKFVYFLCANDSDTEMVAPESDSVIRGGVHRLSDGERLLDFEISPFGHELHGIRYTPSPSWSRYSKLTPNDDYMTSKWACPQNIRKDITDSVVRAINNPRTHDMADSIYPSDTDSTESVMRGATDILYIVFDSADSCSDAYVDVIRKYMISQSRCMRIIRRMKGNTPPMFIDEMVRHSICGRFQMDGGSVCDYTVTMTPTKVGMTYQVNFLDRKMGDIYGSVPYGSSFVDLTVAIQSQLREPLAANCLTHVRNLDTGKIKPVNEVKPC